MGSVGRDKSPPRNAKETREAQLGGDEVCLLLGCQVLTSSPLSVAFLARLVNTTPISFTTHARPTRATAPFGSTRTPTSRSFQEYKGDKDRQNNWPRDPGLSPIVSPPHRATLTPRDAPTRPLHSTYVCCTKRCCTRVTSPHSAFSLPFGASVIGSLSPPQPAAAS
jgi:hypothetical protein